VPNKRASTASASRAAAAPAANKRRAVATATTRISEVDGNPQSERVDDDDGESEDEEQQKTIPPALLTRLLHEFFTQEGTRVTKDANAAVARYMDVFVREAIARSVAEREGGGFLEVSYTFYRGGMVWAASGMSGEEMLIVDTGRGSGEGCAAAFA
jgi:hypothetical protein